MNFPVWFLYYCLLQWAERGVTLDVQRQAEKVESVLRPEPWNQGLPRRALPECLARPEGLIELEPKFREIEKDDYRGVVLWVVRQFNSNGQLSSYRQLWVPVLVTADCQTNLQEFPFSVCYLSPPPAGQWWISCLKWLGISCLKWLVLWLCSLCT